MNSTIPLLPLSAPQALTVNVSTGAAVLSAAITKKFVRLHATVPCFILRTVAGAVTSTTGHFIGGDTQAPPCYDIPMGLGNTKISVLGVGAVAGTLYISELG
jgi:hypothetical protein